jgi:hypothetical protein
LNVQEIINLRSGKFEAFLKLHNADMKKWRLSFIAESVVSSNSVLSDLRYGTAPMRWCHGVTLKVLRKFWAGNEMMLTVLMQRRYIRSDELRYGRPCER